MGKLVDHDFVQQIADPVPCFGLVGKDVVEHVIDMTVEDDSHQLRHEGRRIDDRIGKMRE